MRTIATLAMLCVVAMLLACSGATSTTVSSRSNPSSARIDPPAAGTDDAEMTALDSMPPSGESEVASDDAEAVTVDAMKPAADSSTPEPPTPNESPKPEPKQPAKSARNLVMEQRVPAALMEAALKHVAGEVPFANGIAIGAVGPLRQAEVLVVGDDFVQVESGDEIFFVTSVDVSDVFVGETIRYPLVMITGRRNYETLLGQNSGWVAEAITERRWNEAVGIAELLNAEESLTGWQYEVSQHQAALNEPKPVESWSDVSGAFSVDGRFVSYDGKVLTIRRVDVDQQVQVPAEKLSERSKSQAFSRAKTAARHRREIDRLQKLIDKAGGPANMEE